MSTKRALLIIARSASDQMIDVVDAKNGLKCECTCTCCGDRLVARQGPVKVWHFAHESGADCAGGVESALRLAAKQIIKDEGLIFVGSYNPVKFGLASFTHILHGEFDHEYRNQLIRILHNDQHATLYKFASAELIARLNSVKAQCNNPVIKIDSVELEKRAEGSSLIPDVTGLLDGNKVFIEVVVTHECDEDKIIKLKELNVPVFEIHLTPLKYHRFTMSDVWNAIVSGDFGEFKELAVYNGGKRNDRREWLVKPPYLVNADAYAYEFLAEAFTNLQEDGRLAREKKKADNERLAAEAAEKAARKTKLRIFNTTVIVTEEKYHVAVWTPYIEDRGDYNEIATVLNSFKAKRRDTDWVIPKSTVKGAVVKALNERYAAQLKAYAEAQSAREVAAEVKRAAYAQEQASLAEESRLRREHNAAEREAIQYERHAEFDEEESNYAFKPNESQVNAISSRDAKLQRQQERKDAIAIIHLKHKDIANYKWRLKVMNDDLIALGYEQLSSMDDLH